MDSYANSRSRPGTDHPGRCPRRATGHFDQRKKTGSLAGAVFCVPLKEHGWNYTALWRIILICFENSSKSLSVVNIENLFLLAMAHIKKSVFEPCIPFERQRLKYFAAVT